MSMFDHPLGLIKEVHVQRILMYSDSEGVFYELLTRESLAILVGKRSDGVFVEVEGYPTYGGPHAERLLKEVSQMWIDANGIDPETGEEVKASHSDELIN